MGLKTIKTILILLISTSLWGQTAIRGSIDIKTDGIVSDTINNSPNKAFEKRIKVVPIDKVKSELEIRFYKLTALSNTKNLRIIEFKNKEWHAYEYDERNNPVKIKKYELNATTDLESFTIKLLDQKLTSLPSQSGLKDKMKKFTDVKGRQMESKITVTDGHSYTIEFKIGDSFRIYEFNNPDSYAGFYENVDELTKYVTIKNLFESELSRK